MHWGWLLFVALSGLNLLIEEAWSTSSARFLVCQFETITFKNTKALALEVASAYINPFLAWLFTPLHLPLTTPTYTHNCVADNTACQAVPYVH